MRIVLLASAAAVGVLLCWAATKPTYTVLTLCSLVDRQSPISHHERHGGLIRTNKGKALQYRYEDVEEAVQDGGGHVLYAGAVETVFAGRHSWWERDRNEPWGDDEQWHVVIVAEYPSLEAYRDNRKRGLLHALLREVEYREEVISEPETPLNKVWTWLWGAALGTGHGCEEEKGVDQDPAGMREEGHTHDDHSHSHTPMANRLREWREKGKPVGSSGVEILEVVRYNRTLMGPEASVHGWQCHMRRVATAARRQPLTVWFDRTAQIYPDLAHYGGLWHAWGVVGYPSHNDTWRAEDAYREHLRQNVHSRLLLATRRLRQRSGDEKRIAKPSVRDEPTFPYYMDTNTEHMYKTLHNLKEHSEL